MSGIGLQLNSAPAVGFDQPFEMLAACHERVERSLRLLERLGEHLMSQGADEAARSAARDVQRYFDLAAPQHHEDEERHVLPALRAAGQSVLAQQVLADHARMAEAWARLSVQLQAIGRGDAADAITPAAQAEWKAFAQLYRAHLALEDAEVFPAAAPLLDAPAQRAMGEEMAQRRGATRRSLMRAPLLRPRARAPTASR
jgi:hemerythrin-like domain-containing protein